MLKILLTFPKIKKKILLTYEEDKNTNVTSNVDYKEVVQNVR